jgi:hypothetical protein
LERQPQHPLDAARAALDDALPLLSNDPMSTANTFIQEDPERAALEQLSDGELVRRAARALTITICLIADAMMRQATIAVIKPAEVGVLMRALSEGIQAVTAALYEREKK